MSECIDARLVILGEGTERQSLQALVEELNLAGKVDLPGFDPNPFMYLKRADVYVLSSNYEGLPGSLIQAMALGRPVVATACAGGVRETLEDGKWGALVPVGDAERMAQAILLGLQGGLPDPSPRANAFAVDQALDGYLSLLSLSDDDGCHG